VSDTHLGHAAYHKVNAEGLNQREEDVLLAFQRVVDKALELRPDVVLHSGDLFDVVRPTNRAVGQAVEQVLRLTRAGIPVVAIAGNHESPRLRETGSVFRFLEFFDGIHAVYRGRPEVVRLGDLAVHAVPQAANQAEVRAQLEAQRPDPRDRFHVLAAHVAVSGVKAFAMGEFNEHIVPTSALHADFDYVALGHYHACTQVAPNAWYAGSTERMSFGEAGQPKGFLLADLEQGTVDFHPIATRTMLDLEPVDADGLDAPALQHAVLRALEQAKPEGKIVRLRVERVPRHVYASLDLARIQRAGREALHCQVKVEFAEAQRGEAGQEGSIGPLADEFDRFLAREPLAGLDREALRARAVGLLREASG
jgi:DNA repair exonuclease SbcCD nuclease subunit